MWSLRALNPWPLGQMASANFRANFQSESASEVGSDRSGRLSGRLGTHKATSHYLSELNLC